MKSFVGGLIVLILSVSVDAEPLLEGRVRLSSGQPAVGVQVRLFDLTNLRRFVGTTTDEAGHFALPLQAFSKERGTAPLTGFVLGQNYPNPFNPSTVIPYEIPASAHVRLEVFNLLGQRLATLVDGVRPAGTHTAQWDGTDVAGRAVGAGVYIYRLSGGGVTVSRRMVLVDGQAGVSAVGTAAQGTVWSAVEGSVEADGPVYGLTVSGQGLVPYVNPDFRVGIDEVDIVIETYDGIPRMKLAISGVLGDVNGDGRVDIVDALIVAIYSVDSSVPAAHIPNIFLGDVDADGDIDFTDAYLIGTYIVNPSDPVLPPGIGDNIVDDHGDTLSEATQVSLRSSTAGSLLFGDTDYFRVTMSSLGTLVAYTTGSTDTYGSILDSSGTVLASDDEGGESSNFRVFTSVSSGTYYIEVRGYSSSTTGNYTLHVASDPSDLVVESPEISDSTLGFGQPFTLQATVRNQGAGPADTTTLVYYRSFDATISSSDTRVGSVDVSLLFSSDARAASISLIAPEDAGTYYYGACVQSVVGESNTDNNCSDAVSVTVSQMPQMYWTDRGDETEGKGKIQHTNLDGSNIKTLISGLDWPYGLALDVTEGKVYWMSGTKIQRANLDGSNIETLVTTEQDEVRYPSSLALDVARGKMYWADWGTGGDLGTAKIQRVNLDGSNVEDVVIGLDKPFGLALDVAGGKVYWTDTFAAKIQRANLDGSNIETLALVTASPWGLALDVAGRKMYWTGGGKIQRTNLDGSNIETLVTTEQDEVGISRYLALDVAEGKMYWTGSRGIRGRTEWPAGISRANLDGSNVETLVTGLEPSGLVLDLSGVEESGGDGSGVGNMTGSESELTPEIIALYDTLISNFQNIFFSVLVGTTSVPGEGGGSVEIVGNDWTFQDYSPAGALVINGALNVRIDQNPIPLTGTVTLSGSQEAEVVLDILIAVEVDGLSVTGTMTIDGAEFDVAEILEAAEAE